MYNETQLAAIRLFGDKTLSEGCIFLGRFWYGGIDKILPAKICFRVGKGFHVTYRTMYGDSSDEEYDIYGTREDFEILGHEPHLEDLFRVAEERGFYVSMSPEITRIYKEFGGEPIETILIPSMPLLSQPHLSEIVNLFSK